MFFFEIYAHVFDSVGALMLGEERMASKRTKAAIVFPYWEAHRLLTRSFKDASTSYHFLFHSVYSSSPRYGTSLAQTLFIRY